MFQLILNTHVISRSECRNVAISNSDSEPQNRMVAPVLAKLNYEKNVNCVDAFGYK